MAKEFIYPLFDLIWIGGLFVTIHSQIEDAVLGLALLGGKLPKKLQATIKPFCRPDSITFYQALLLCPIFLASCPKEIACWVGGAALLDVLDGHVARNFPELTSKYGGTFDSVVDKLTFVGTVGKCWMTFDLVILNKLLFALAILIDVGRASMALPIVIEKRKKTEDLSWEVSPWGKVKRNAQAITFEVFLFNPESQALLTFLLCLTLFFGLMSVLANLMPKSNYYKGMTRIISKQLAKIYSAIQA